jgi:hypothetical protein
MPGDELSEIALNGNQTSFPPQSLIAIVGSPNFSLFVLIIFVVAVLDFGQIRRRDDVSAQTLEVPQQQQQLIFCFKDALF